MNLKAGAESLGIELSDYQVNQMHQFADRLEEFNKVIN